jgi:hypothetical protein
VRPFALIWNHALQIHPFKRSTSGQFCWPIFAHMYVKIRVTRFGEFSPVGRLFTMGIFVKITEITQILFSTVKVMYKFSQKMIWATFWPTFLQTHLVTLVKIYVYTEKLFFSMNKFWYVHAHACCKTTCCCCLKRIWSADLGQGCQMVSFQTKNPNLGIFWMTLDLKYCYIPILIIWNILRPL